MEDWKRYYKEYGWLDFRLHPPDFAWEYPFVTYGAFDIKNGDIIGQSLITIEPYRIKPGKWYMTLIKEPLNWIYLTQLKVDEPCRGYGVATSIIRKIESDYLWLRKGIYLQCKDHRKTFYEHLGYQVCERDFGKRFSKKMYAEYNEKWYLMYKSRGWV